MTAVETAKRPTDCKYCGARNLFWFSTEKGLRLVDVTMTEHDCPEARANRELRDRIKAKKTAVRT